MCPGADCCLSITLPRVLPSTWQDLAPEPEDRGQPAREAGRTLPRVMHGAALSQLLSSSELKWI